MILKLHYYGDPILRKKCEPVKEVTPEIKQLVRDMIETVIANNGIGVAASQLGHLVRIFIVREEKVDSQGNFSFGEPKAYINPVLSSPSEKTEVQYEGCLSIPGMHLEIERPFSITVEALDSNGKPFKETLEGYHARQIMHENDHLNGTLYIDRAFKDDRKRIEPHLRKIKDKYSNTF
jgi:peptide deformylase